jgi:tetratricopeptide (TPR) repeat protein
MRSLLALVALTCVAERALAEEADLEAAHAIFARADADYRLGHFEEAAKGYEQAYAIGHAPEVLYDVAQANRRWYETSDALAPARRAYDAYRAFVRDAPQAPQRANAEHEIVRLRSKLVATERGRAAVALAEKLLAEADPEDAMRLADRRLSEPGLSRDELVRALETAGRARARAGETAQATEVFARALSVDPLVPLGADGGPDAAAAYAAARDRVRRDGPFHLEPAPPSPASAGQPATVRIRAHDPLKLLSSFQIYARLPGGVWSSLEEGARGGETALGLPEVGHPIGHRVEWYAVALDANRATLGEIGTPGTPLAITIEGPAPKRWYRRPWVWATLAIGAAAAGAAVGLGVYYGERTSPPVFRVPVP